MENNQMSIEGSRWKFSTSKPYCESRDQYCRLVLGVLALRVTLLIFSPTLRLTLVYNQLYLARQSSCSPTALITT